MKKIKLLIPIILSLTLLAACGSHTNDAKKSSSSSVALSPANKIAYSLSDYERINLNFLSKASSAKPDAWVKADADNAFGSETGNSSFKVAGFDATTYQWRKGNSRITITFAGKGGSRGAFMKSIVSATKAKSSKVATRKAADTIKVGDSEANVKKALGTAYSQSENRTSDGHILHTWQYSLDDGSSLTVKFDNSKIINIASTPK
ncbi:hypothetical protein [Lacticaseibacillus hulanensis]|uniref:hypothetical protein n=1 Tax=Lacticaseibacillus hulanensis TaxID=2493111 RepID=UPI000FD81FB4|nr:hypothetical protein [Lacticaseibacillus hulanensis]